MSSFRRFSAAVLSGFHISSQPQVRGSIGKASTVEACFSERSCGAWHEMPVRRTEANVMETTGSSRSGVNRACSAVVKERSSVAMRLGSIPEQRSSSCVVEASLLRWANVLPPLTMIFASGYLRARSTAGASVSSVLLEDDVAEVGVPYLVVGPSQNNDALQFLARWIQPLGKALLQWGQQHISKRAQWRDGDGDQARCDDDPSSAKPQKRNRKAEHSAQRQQVRGHEKISHAELPFLDTVRPWLPACCSSTDADVLLHKWLILRDAGRFRPNQYSKRIIPYEQVELLSVIATRARHGRPRRALHAPKQKLSMAPRRAAQEPFCRQRGGAGWLEARRRTVQNIAIGATFLGSALLPYL